MAKAEFPAHSSEKTSEKSFVMGRGGGTYSSLLITDSLRSEKLTERFSNNSLAIWNEFTNRTFLPSTLRKTKSPNLEL